MLVQFIHFIIFKLFYYGRIYEKEIQGFHEIPSKIELNNYKFFQESIQNQNFRSVSGETDFITGEIEKEDYKLGDYRDFWIAVDDNPEDYKSEKFNFECVAVGKNCYIWFSDSNNELTKKEFFNETGGINGDDCSFQVLADKFDSICDLMKKYFGSHEFTSKKFNNIINSKEKINIIVSDLFNPDGIYFSAIDLTKLKYYYNKNNEIFEETALPIVFYADKYKIDETPDNENIRLTEVYRIDLAGGGYSIHYIGKEGTQYTFIDDNIDKNMKYFIYMQ